MKKWLNVLTKDKTVPLEVFVRHCHFSSASSHKKRHPYFSRESCHRNLLHTLQGEKKVNVTFFLDNHFPMKEPHFIKKETLFPVIEMDKGTEALSFLFMLDYVLGKKFDPETIIYFVEDDYLHKKGWVAALREGIELPVDYLTLFDHRDKYTFSQYQSLQSRLYVTKTCHWRTTPSTTNTYAMKAKTLAEDEALHRQFSQGKTITEDHAKFLALREKGKILISSVPGFATHMEPEFASPCIDWEEVQRAST